MPHFLNHNEAIEIVIFVLKDAKYIKKRPGMPHFLNHNEAIEIVLFV